MISAISQTAAVLLRQPTSKASDESLVQRIAAGDQLAMRALFARHQEKPITPHDPNVFHPAATCHGRITDGIDLGLVDEFKTVSALTQKPVKITMTGPHMLAKVAYDEVALHPCWKASGFLAERILGFGAC